MTVIAADLGGTKLAVGLFDTDGVLKTRTTVTRGSRQGREVGQQVRQECARLLEAAARAGEPAEAIGVGVPGIYRPDTGTVWAPNIPAWEAYPLLAELSSLSGGEIPVSIESDRSCCILGEVWQGAARGCRNAVFITVGTGIGAGALVDGRLLRGNQDIAGAIGWLALHRPFDPKYASVGCFEYHASGDGIARIARERIAADPAYRGVLWGKNFRAEDVFLATGSGDPIAGSVVEECIGLWGMAAANLISLFNPEVILFGGGVFGPAVKFLSAIRSEAEKWAQPIAFRGARIEASALGGDAALYGAAFAAVRGLSPDLPPCS